MAPKITDPLPRAVAAEVERLCVALDDAVPARQIDRNLLVASWNLRAFGDLTEKWRAGAGDAPARDLRALAAIAEIVSRFDVVALQEVRGNIKAFRHLLKRLGPDWGFLLTDVTRGKAGNDERMAFLFDTRRVKPSGLACELVVPPEWSPTIEDAALDRQFARTPYAASFLAGGETFILVTLHVRFGKKTEDRLLELKWIARWMADWARREAEWGHNLIVLGDFNIDRKGDPAFEAFTSTGLRPPEELEGLPRTIFDDGPEHFYDQIAWFAGEGRVPMLSLRYSGRAGSFDFVPHLLGSLTRNRLSWKISDHYPLWTEFLARRA